MQHVERPRCDAAHLTAARQAGERDVLSLAPWLLGASLLAVVIMLVPTAISARIFYGVAKTQRAL